MRMPFAQGAIVASKCAIHWIMQLILRNPHSVLAVLETRPKDVQEITVPKHASTEGWDKVIQLARRNHIPVNSSSPSAGRAQMGREKAAMEHHSARAGIAEARVRERSPMSAEELFANATSQSGGKGLWLAFDHLQDPHNVGAIFRSAAFFGVKGILMTQDRSSSLTSIVYDVASGGVEYVPFAVHANLQRAFEIAKEAGLWILGTSEHAHDSYQSVQRDRPWLLVLGNEEKGMRRLTEESCDVLCGIPCFGGKVTSLNVSVAAGVLISWLA